MYILYKSAQKCFNDFCVDECYRDSDCIGSKVHTSKINSFLFLNTLAFTIHVSLSVLPKLSQFFFNTKLTSFTEMFVNDNIKVVNITKVVDITREEGDRMEVGDIK